MGNRMRGMAPHNCFRCRGDDKWVAVAVTNDEEWTAFCNAMGNPEWTEDERFREVKMLQSIEELGIEKGIEKGKIEAARKMLEEEFDLNAVLRITELSIEQLKKAGLVD